MDLIDKKHGRVAILFHRMGPYHFARLQAAGKLLDTTLIEVFKEDKVYAWSQVLGADGFERLTLFEKEPQPVRELVAGIHAALDRCQPEVVVVPGWSGAIAFGALQWCAIHRVPAILMSESTEWDESRHWWKEWLKRRILKLCASGLVGGKPHAEYIARLGIPTRNIFQGYDAVDNEYFTRQAADSRSQKIEAKGQHDLPDKYFLASARFIEKKNLSRLIQAYGRYRELAKKKAGDAELEPWKLVLLGDGPLRSIIDSQISTLNLGEYILLPGFKQYEELPKYYGFAKVFIHASTTEQWGLVVNEAMASSLPVLVSNRCGCAQDLVSEGFNGFTFDPQQVEQLANLMLRFSEAPEKAKGSLEEMGAASLKIISKWGPERFADGLMQAVKAAQSTPRSKPTLLDTLLLKLLLLK